MVIRVPALKGLERSFLSETVPAASVFLKPLVETVAPAGTPLRTSDVSLVCFLVELLKVKVRLTRIWGADLPAAFRPAGFELPFGADGPGPGAGVTGVGSSTGGVGGAGTTVEVRLTDGVSTLPTASVARTSDV